MKKRTVRLILDCMICDAMSPEFKKANDILLRIIKTNDRTDGLPHTRLAELNKAFKANDPKAAKVAYDKLAALIAKGEKDLQDGLNEAKSKLAETTKAFDTAKAALAQQKPLAALFDKFVKAIDAAKTNPKGVSKLNAYADKLKAFGDFSKRIMQIQQMATAKKNIAKQCDMLKKAVETGKAKHAKAMKKAEDDLAKAKDRVAVFKEMDKIRTKKIAEFAKEREDVQKLGSALPSESDSYNNVKEMSFEERKKKAIEFVKTKIVPVEEQAQKNADKLVERFKRVREEYIANVSDSTKNASAQVKMIAPSLSAISSGAEKKVYVIARLLSERNFAEIGKLWDGAKKNVEWEASNKEEQKKGIDLLREVNSIVRDAHDLYKKALEMNVSPFTQEMVLSYRYELPQDEMVRLLISDVVDRENASLNAKLDALLDELSKILPTKKTRIRKTSGWLINRYNMMQEPKQG